MEENKMESNCPICYKPLDTGFRCSIHGSSPIIQSPMSIQNIVQFVDTQIQNNLNYGMSKIEMKINEMETRLSEKLNKRK
jgi:hypothetical protein